MTDKPETPKKFDAEAYVAEARAAHKAKVEKREAAKKDGTYFRD